MVDGGAIIQNIGDRSRHSVERGWREELFMDMLKFMVLVAKLLGKLLF
jgi:hypothetical protein